MPVLPARTLALFALAFLLAAGTALFARSWLKERAAQIESTASIARPAPPPRAVLVAHAAISRGQILKRSDFTWQTWPDGPIDPAYILSGTRSVESFAGSVAREPFAPGEPITLAKIVAPGDRGFLAAVLRPGMRAVSVPVTATSGISGFIFPGDRVDLLITQTVMPTGAAEQTAHKESETILHNIRVLAVDQRLAGKDGEAALAHTATLEVTAKQSEIIALASEMGRLSMSLRSLADAPAQKSTDSSAPTQNPTYTLDSEVNPLLPKPFIGKENQSATTITILRGNGQSEKAAVSQPPSRGV
ncbi:MAG TPA: Flp pilus assembly protein CpaB [Stellaceae bacterium]|nr:Flp pilus assembly protein CpaB [Stellaceae bacterium]